MYFIFRPKMIEKCVQLLNIFFFQRKISQQNESEKLLLGNFCGFACKTRIKEAQYASTTR